MSNKKHIRERSSTGEIERSMRLTGKGIDNDGLVTHYYGHVSLDATDDNLEILEVLDGAQDVHALGNNLTFLVFPDSVEYVQCRKELFDYDACEITHVDIEYEIT